MNDNYVCVATCNTLGYTFTHFDNFTISTVRAYQFQTLMPHAGNKEFRYYEEKIEESE